MGWIEINFKKLFFPCSNFFGFGILKLILSNFQKNRLYITRGVIPSNDVT